MALLAHVDAGKTTLSEGIMYLSGALRKLGRVDHKDAFLDTDAQERERGITIFSKMAMLKWKDREITLMDTPGHVDFSGEMERVLPILDAAILVISGSDGVQGHTATLWRLLKKYEIPTFIFINKMDQPGTDRMKLLEELHKYLSSEVTDFEDENVFEEAAVHDEEALEEYLESGALSDDTISRMILKRRLFPAFFGSALKLMGIQQIMDAVTKYARPKAYPEEFSARVYKIGRDQAGARLTYVKIIGGSLKVRTLLKGEMQGSGEGGMWEEKVSQIRLYSGSKFTTTEEAHAGTVCALMGLNYTKCMDMLGAKTEEKRLELEPVFSYKVILPKDTDVPTALSNLRILEEEDPLLRVKWLRHLGEIHVQLMGEVQLEVLKRLLKDRFQMEADFGDGGILYKETIQNAVEGVGHYEPLRHYAEVHLLMEPGERGSGIRIQSAVSEDELDRNWQRLIITHLLEKKYVGVLTGSPVTDIKVSIIAGRAHLKHTEGGDFRQATYRAFRQGLMQAENVLLEPWYDVRLEIPAECVGRAMSDLTQMGGSYVAPELIGEEAVVTGRVPVQEARYYAKEVQAYTKGRGRYSFSVRGYEKCRDQEKVVREIGYDPERDVDNTADSVFCSHGAGVIVKWNEANRHMHIQTGVLVEKHCEEETETPARQKGGFSDDEELKRIFERTYGQVKDRAFETSRSHQRPVEKVQVEIRPRRPEYLLVDGYNILHAWEDTREEAKRDLDSARRMIMDILSNFQGFTSQRLILVFDAYKVSGGVGSVSKYNGIDVVYTKEAETADSFIEKTAYEISKYNMVRVATSDALEQMIIFGSGALRVSAQELRKEVESANVEIRKFIEKGNGALKDYKLMRAYKDAKKKIGETD
ncbi:MAG: TetM/TetW/TetO/TetS family tetracycline resistance ribosomal protection protein [Clostridia bacterium]|nr:TetM/TetW/TetO/TetS family tetracycline resistance ribosomal protection protein [Clostridia bacterium]